MQAVFSMSQLQYFQLSTIVELYKKNQETQKFCPLALIFHLAPVLKSTYPERMVLVTQYKQYFHVSAPLVKLTFRKCDGVFACACIILKAVWKSSELLTLLLRAVFKRETSQENNLS